MGLLVGKLALAISPKLQRNDYEKDECRPIRCVQKYCCREFLIRSRQNVKDRKKHEENFGPFLDSRVSSFLIFSASFQSYQMSPKRKRLISLPYTYSLFYLTVQPIWAPTHRHVSSVHSNDLGCWNLSLSCSQ